MWLPFCWLLTEVYHSATILSLALPLPSLLCWRAASKTCCFVLQPLYAHRRQQTFLTPTKTYERQTKGQCSLTVHSTKISKLHALGMGMG